MTERRSIRAPRSGFFGPRPEEQASSRGDPLVVGEPVNAPGVPGSLPFISGGIWSPQVFETLDQIISFAIQKALETYSIFTQTKPFDNYDVYAVPIVAAAQAVRLDTLGDAQKGRRALMIINPDAVNPIWVGKNAQTAANNGIPVAPNFGSYMVAIHERATHFGFCAGNNTAIVVWYA